MAKILCIDDDPDVVETCQLILKEKGYDIDVAYTAKEGYAKAKENHPDLIILDVMMEDITAGFHAAYQFRQDEDLKFKPILMLTSINQKQKFNFHPDRDGEYLPVDEFIEKPIVREKLLESCARLLALPKESLNIGGRKK